MKQMIFAFLAVGICSQSMAEGILTNAHVSSIRMDSDGRTIVYFDQTFTGTPAGCSVYSNALAINATTTGGKALLAFIVSAKAMNVSLNVTGSGACGVFGGNVEDWSSGTMS